MAEYDFYDRKEVAKRHRGHLAKIANFHAELREMRDDMKMVSEHYQDNGDTAAAADEALLALGSLLADLVTYTNEYDEDESQS